MRKSVSVIKEVLKGEKRVILLPEHVKKFKENGFDIYVESNAGEALGYDNTAYTNEGAEVVDTDTAWRCSDFVLKYKGPAESEYKYFRKDLTLSAIFHAEGNKTLIEQMCDAGITAYSYEFFRIDDDIFPLAVPGGEIAGKVGFIHASYLLQSQFNGSGVFLADVIGAKKPKVVVIGYGNVGNAVIRMAANLGNEVVVFGTNAQKLRKYASTLDSNVKCLVLNKKDLINELKDADAVFGAILISTYDTEAIIDEDMLSVMKKGSIIVDITCGYGPGYLPTFKQPTSLTQPVYEYEGILHCKIDNLPAAYPMTTTKAYLNNAMPYILNLANSHYDKDIKDTVSENGKIIDNGKIVHPVISQHMRFYEEQEQ